MAQDFCPVTYTLLEEITSGDQLKFKSAKTGTIYDAKPEDTMLASEELGEIHSVSKYKNTLKVSASVPINPRVRLPKGCDQCKRKVVSYQRLGPEKIVFYACLCGKTWHN